MSVVCDQQSCTVLSPTCYVNILYAFNATHMLRMTVLYAFNALPTPRAWRGHDEPDVRRLENAQARLGGRWTRLSK
jgi:hypothetical protein